MFIAAPRTWYCGGALYITSAFSTRFTGVDRNSVASCSAVIVEGRPLRITVTDELPASESTPDCSDTPGRRVSAS